MAAMKARRPNRRTPEKKQGGPPRRAAPPPAHGVPRLAAIKGAFDGEPQVNGKSLMLALTGVVLFVGAAIAGATWIGGSLFDARQAFQRSADAAVVSAGFGVEHIDVTGEGVAAARIAEVRAAIAPQGAHSLLAMDPGSVKARVESLDWVAEAKVRRLWPSTLRVDVRRRQEFARWRENGVVSVIDANGERLLSERAVDHPNLPLIVGRGAGPKAEPLLIALEQLPQVRAHTAAIVRVGDRRWNLELSSGTLVRLPEAQPELALARLETLQTRHRLLDRPVAELDLRAPGRLSVRVFPQLAGGPAAAVGGV
ncbi:MAG TPA: cell division protein FtsQ/DivIB [Caulobacterales bacterium]|nr:cell division protein FtsQ/DivIB [Caulobacterales bacterium]